MAGSDDERKHRDDNVDSRLARVEANYIRLHEDVSGLYKKLDNFADSIREDFSTITNDMNSKSKPQWNVIIMAVTLVITIMVLTFSPIRESIQDNRTTTRSNTEKISELHSEHSAFDERLNAVEREIFRSK